MSRRRQLVFFSLSMFLSWLLIESISLAFLHLHARPKGLLYEPEKLLGELDRAAYQRYLAVRDPLLGWPASGWAGDPTRGRRQDPSGARHSPAFPDPGNACVSLYGDSFTWSDEVGDADAWGNALARLLGCRVANYGYGGHGTDQAYLRFTANPDDEASIVILGHSTGNVIRNVNQWIVFRYMPARYAKWRDFKPRFVLNEAGRLQPVPLPRFRFDELSTLARAPSESLEDFFLPGAAAGPVEATFPWSLTIARAYRAHFHRYGTGLFSQRDYWIETYYEPGHPSAAFELTEQILVEFAETARQRRKQPLVFLLPNGVEVQRFQSKGEWILRPLVDAVSKRVDVPIVHVGEELARRLAVERLCELYTQPGCKGHFNAKGYALVALIAYEALQTIRSE